jgi:hypothetical protein
VIPGGAVQVNPGRSEGREKSWEDLSISYVLRVFSLPCVCFMKIACIHLKNIECTERTKENISRIS